MYAWRLLQMLSLTAAATIASPYGAEAIVLDPASAFAQAGGAECHELGPPPQGCHAFVSIPGFSGPTEVDMASAVLASPVPVVAALYSYSSYDGTNPHTGSGAQLYYQMAIIGPPGYADLNVNLRTSASLTVTGERTSAVAQSYVSVGLTKLGQSCALIGLGTCESIPYPDVITIHLPTNTPIPVNLSAGASGYTFPHIWGNGMNELVIAEANADPYFYISPLMPNYEAYSLELDSGVGNAPLPTVSPPESVPEPASWMIIGAGLVGVGARRRLSRART